MTGSKVLIVEDEVIVAMSIERSLSSFGYDVVGLSTTPEDSIRMAEELRPDIVLMDINLEGEIDGIDAAKKISEISDIPVVYLTSYTNEETLRRAISTNPYGYLTKPVRVKEIYNTIEIVLNKHRVNLTEKKLKNSKRSQWEILNSIDLGLCFFEYDEGDGKCTISAINDKACEILKVSGRDLWKGDAGLEKFIPGISGAVGSCISEGKKRACFSTGDRPVSPADHFSCVIRIAGHNQNYSVLLSLVEPSENIPDSDFDPSGEENHEMTLPERERKEIMKRHISSIIDRCTGEKVDIEEIGDLAREIDKILDLF